MVLVFALSQIEGPVRPSLSEGKTARASFKNAPAAYGEGDTSLRRLRQGKSSDLTPASPSATRPLSQRERGLLPLPLAPWERGRGSGGWGEVSRLFSAQVVFPRAEQCLQSGKIGFRLPQPPEGLCSRLTTHREPYLLAGCVGKTPGVSIAQTPQNCRRERPHPRWIPGGRRRTAFSP